MSTLKGAPEASPTLPPLEDYPKDFTFSTTLLCRGKLAPEGQIWLKLQITRKSHFAGRAVFSFYAPVPKGLSDEQKEYLAKLTRLRVLKEKGY